MQDADEDYNPRNVLLRCVYYEQVDSKRRYSLGSLFSATAGSGSGATSGSGTGMDAETLALPHTWHLAGQSEVSEKVNGKKGGRYPGLLQFAGHVTSADAMDELLLGALDQEIVEGNITRYRVFDCKLPASEVEQGKDALFEAEA